MIALELNDAGLMAAGSDGALLEVEPGAFVSPGVALIEEDRVQAGLAAEKSCRRLPRQTNHLFWSRLASDPLRDPAFAGWSHADLAHAHLSRIWRHLAPGHQELLVTVPDTYTGHQLELLAGIMNALSIPARGFLPLSLAALPQNAPAEGLVHLDLFLDHALLTVLDCRGEARLLESMAIEGQGLDHLRTAWMRVVADEFVHHTRFDPFHAAETEQALYDQLPDLLAALTTAEDTPVEMTTPSATHRILLKRETVEQTLLPLMDATHRQLYRLQEALFGRQALRTLLVSHRAARLPGFCRRLAAATGVRVLPLAKGAAAMGAHAYANAFPPREERRGVPFLKQRPDSEDGTRPSAAAPMEDAVDQGPPPTHLVYRSRGYPVSKHPLIIGREVPDGSAGIRIWGRTEGVSRHHCRVALKKGRLKITDTSTYGTFVDGVKIAGERELGVGQSIRVGTPGETLQVIACLDTDETPTA
jgi:hypothetical protein